MREHPEELDPRHLEVLRSCAVAFGAIVGMAPVMGVHLVDGGPQLQEIRDAIAAADRALGRPRP